MISGSGLIIWGLGQRTLHREFNDHHSCRPSLPKLSATDGTSFHRPVVSSQLQVLEGHANEQDLPPSSAFGPVSRAFNAESLLSASKTRNHGNKESALSSKTPSPETLSTNAGNPKTETPKTATPQNICILPVKDPNLQSPRP